MRGVLVVTLLAAICGLIQGSSSIYSGFLGCRFSLSVCRQNEECVDDRLFGTCQRLDHPRDDYKYYLLSHQLRALEAEVSNLIQDGYTWEDLYTQCVLANILLSYRRGENYDTNFCDTGGVTTQEQPQDLNDATIDLLKAYLEDYYEAVSNGKESSLNQPKFQDFASYDGSDTETPYLFNSEADYPNPIDKKDEIVQVHKYLKSHKRDPFANPQYDQLDYPQYDSIGVSNVETERDYDYNDLLQNLSPEKIALLQEYLGPIATGPSDDEAKKQKGIFSVVAMPADDASLMDELLQGNTDVSSLSDEDIERLTKYVDQMLLSLKDFDGIETPPDSQDIPVPSLEEPITEEKSVSLDENNDADNIQVSKKEELNEELLGSPAVEAISPRVLNAHQKDPVILIPTQKPKLSLVDLDEAWIKLDPDIDNKREDAKIVMLVLQRHLGLPDNTFTDIQATKDKINFRVKPNPQGMDAEEVARESKKFAGEVKNETKYDIVQSGVGDPESGVPVNTNQPKYFVLTFVLCGVIAGIVLAVVAIYIVRRHLQSKEKLAQLAGTHDGVEASNDYQDLCRQHMQSKSSEKPEPLHVAARMGSVSATEGPVHSPSSRSSTSSWSEEPVTTNMDISTGHIVLSYMEDHLKNKDRLDEEWENLRAYEAEPNSTATATDPANMRKNRYGDVLPYDHSRVTLATATNVSGSDYSNASTITDHDPRNPAYIATQGPLPHTVADFWQMVWEQGSVVIVNLTRLTENGQAMCHRYWPEEGSDLYHIYEVHLVSEHIWCEDYLVRSFYLKNLQTNETRTVTQFHFQTWTDLGIPGSSKALLDFRRKVNKSYRGRSCPIVVHCSDGSGRTGTYCLVDMVLNRLSKGAKEIDIAATLEHIRDQRMLMVKTKEQFEFALASVAEEVHAILKSLPQ